MEDKFYLVKNIDVEVLGKESLCRSLGTDDIVAIMEHIEPPDYVYRESIPFRLYVRHTFTGDREYAYIGMTRKVRDMLGMPLEAWKNMNDSIKKKESIIETQRQQLERLEKYYVEAGFIERLKNLFRSTDNKWKTFTEVKYED